MKRLVLALSLSAQLCFAGVWNVRLDTSSVTLGATFPGTPQLTGPQRISSIQIKNNAACEVEVNCSRSSRSVPGTFSVDSLYADSNGTFSTPGGQSLGSACYIRCTSGSSTSGIVTVYVWGY